MDLGLKNKSVVVTGGNRGIGRAIALAFAEEGANVAIVGRDTEALAAVENEIAAKCFEYDVLKASGLYQRTAVSVIVVVGAHRRSYELVHILWPRDGRRKVDEVVAHMLSGGPRIDVAAVETRLTRTPDADALTPRQREILGLLANGKSSKQVAELLHLSPETVRNHIRNILSRLGVHSRVEAVSIAHRRHLI